MTFSYRDNPFPFTNIPNERMKIVLDLGIAPVTADNIAVIRENYPELWNDFILPNGTKKLVELMDTNKIQLTEPELASLLTDFRMNDKTAEEMLFIFSDTVPLKDRTFSNTVRARIVEVHLNPKEIPLLLNSFTQETPRVRSAFLDYAREHSDSIADAVDRTHYIPTEVYSMLSLALGKAAGGWLLSIGRQGIFFIPVIVLLPHYIGLNGVILAQPIDRV